MSSYRLHTRSFHPAATFGSAGFGFSGDNRRFKLDTDASTTSRIRHYLDIDLVNARVISSRPISDPSHHEGMGVTQNYTDPAKQPTADLWQQDVRKYRADGDQSFDIGISYAGKNYAFPGADWEQNIPGTGLSISPRHGIRRTVPDLDVRNRISGHFDRTARRLHITCDLRGDGFPNAETFLVDPGRTEKLALCTHVRVGVATVQLFGDRQIPMGRAMLDVAINPSDGLLSDLDAHQALDYSGDGSAQDLLAEVASAPSTRDAWNTMHTGRDALGPQRRRDLDNSIWGGVRERFGF
jgi:hypothetical protein